MLNGVNVGASESTQKFSQKQVLYSKPVDKPHETVNSAIFGIALRGLGGMLRCSLRLPITAKGKSFK